MQYPSIHPNVLQQFVRGDATVRLLPVKLDVKQAEFVRCLLVNQRQTCFTANDHGAIPVFVSTDPDLEALFCIARPAVSLVVDFHDKGRRLDFLGLSEAIWQTIQQHNLQVIYLKLQIHEPANYAALNRLPMNVHTLSCPLLLGGSRFHITVQEDYDGDALFRRVLAGNPQPAYEWDWSFVGAPTSDDRSAAFEVLRGYDKRKRFFTISQPGHPDAAVATVPMEEYLRISRVSRVCLSLNGRGPWCLKDGELLAADCCVLRQWHPVLTLNPLTPRDGVHWAVAKTPDLPAAIEALLADDRRREDLRAAGHALFRDVLRNHAWSNVYVQRLVEFLKSRQKSAWGQLAIA